MRHRLARHALPPLLAGTLLFLSACKGTSQESPPSSPAPETAAPTANIAAQPDPVEAAVATPSGASLPVCKVGDSRTMVMTWRATFDANNILSIDPPQQDGTILRVELRSAGTGAVCAGSGPHVFRSPEDPAAPTAGGLLVRIAGEAKGGAGACVFSGYYLSVENPGNDENWGESHLTPVNDAEVIDSGRYCFEEE